MGMEHIDIARVCHEANRALQIAQNDPTIPVSPHWDDETEETRQGSLTGVRGILVDGNSPADSHATWAETRLKDGWTYGPVKDPVAKTHPLLVPYAELDEAARLKDALFYSICHTLGDAE